MQLDLLGSKQVIEWQEGKAAFLFASEGCWSELPHLYARYGTTATAAADRQAEDARARVRGAGLRFGHAGHRARLRRADGARRARGADAAGLQQDAQLSRMDGGARRRHRSPSSTMAMRRRSAAAIRPETRFVFAETFTNPLVRAQDFDALREVIDARARDRAGAAAGPRHHHRLAVGVQGSAARQRRRHRRRQRHQVAGRQRSRHVGLHRDQRHAVRQLGDGPDGDARRHPRLAPGGGGDRRRSTAPASRMRGAAATASKVAAFLSAHPKVSEVFHPSLPIIPTAGRSTGTTRVMARCCRSAIKGADEDRTRHFADVLATTVIVRYALSFDGLATKVNHHRTVSEYFTAPDQLKRNGFDRLIRLAIGLEDADDLIAALNWTLHHGDRVTRRRHRTVAARSAPPRWGSDHGRRRTSRHQAGRIRQADRHADSALRRVDRRRRRGGRHRRPERAGGRRPGHRLGRAAAAHSARCGRRRG